MGLLKKYLLEAIGQMERDKVKMEFFGDLSPLSQELRDLCEQTRRISKRYDGCQVNICLNYGGRDEILRAARAYALDCVEGRADPNHLTQENFSGYLFSRGVPDPDLIIRPSGELRYPISCCGSPPMRSSTLRMCCGRISAKQSCCGPSPAIRAGPGDLEVFEKW